MIKVLPEAVKMENSGKMVNNSRLQVGCVAAQSAAESRKELEVYRKLVKWRFPVK